MRVKPRSDCEQVTVGSPQQRRLCAPARGDLRYAIEADRQWRREAWAEARHVKTVERINREMVEAQREWDRPHRFFRVKAQCTWGDDTGRIIKRHLLHRIAATHLAGGALPHHAVALTDRGGRLFVFQRIRYYSARTTKAGRGAEAARYGMDGAHVLESGEACIASNIGEHYEEIVAGFDLAERINRSVSINAKTLFHGIMQSCHELTPEQQFAMARDYAEYAFGRQQLPYLVVLHPPNAEGDQRNWHVHILYSLRPTAKTGEDEWTVGKHLRTDLDNAEQFARLRFLWAEELNHACEKAGIAKRYTHLSYAAAGMDYIPQRHLGQGLTAKVRRGEHVALNATNHRIALRNSLKRLALDSRAALLATLSWVKQGAHAAHRSAALAQSVPASSHRFSMVREEFLPAVPSAARHIVDGGDNDDAAQGGAEQAKHREIGSHQGTRTFALNRRKMARASSDDYLPAPPSAPEGNISFALPRAYRDQLPSAAPSAASPMDHRSVRTESLPPAFASKPRVADRTPPRISAREQMYAPPSLQRAPHRFRLLHLLRETVLPAFPGHAARTIQERQHFPLRDHASAASFMQQRTMRGGSTRPGSTAPTHVPAAPSTKAAEAWTRDSRSAACDPDHSGERQQRRDGDKATTSRQTPNGSLSALKPVDGGANGSNSGPPASSMTEQQPGKNWFVASDVRARDGGTGGHTSELAAHAGVDKGTGAQQLGATLSTTPGRATADQLDSLAEEENAARQKAAAERQQYLSELTRAAAAEMLARTALFELLEEERQLLDSNETGQWVVPVEILGRCGMSEEQVVKPTLQKRLKDVDAGYRFELEAIAEYVIRNPHHLTRGEDHWQLNNEAPDEVRSAMHLWRRNKNVQGALRGLAIYPKLGDDQIAKLQSRRATFMAVATGKPISAVNSRTEREPVKAEKDRGLQPPWHTGRGGIGD